MAPAADETRTAARPPSGASSGGGCRDRIGGRARAARARAARAERSSGRASSIAEEGVEADGLNRREHHAVIKAIRGGDLARPTALRLTLPTRVLPRVGM